MSVVLMAVILVALYALWHSRDALEALHRAHLDEAEPGAPRSPDDRVHSAASDARWRAANDQDANASVTLDVDPEVDASDPFDPDLGDFGARRRRRWSRFEASDRWNTDDAMHSGDDVFPRFGDAKAIDDTYGTTFDWRRHVDPCLDPFGPTAHAHGCDHWNRSWGHDHDWGSARASDWHDHHSDHGLGTRWDDWSRSHDDSWRSTSSDFDR